MIRNYKFHNPEGGCFVSFAKTVYEHTARSAELDEETGYYYYGARYYNPQISAWLSVDPIAVYNPVLEVEHYIDGQHNGGVFNSGNLNVYGYTYQNPIIYVDPNGKQTISPHLIGLEAHSTFANYMRAKSGNSGNWVAEGYFHHFRPDLLYYGGNNNMSGMGAVWELKPFRNQLKGNKALSSVLQINHYVGELNFKNEGGLRWATGTKALGSPLPFDENKLTLKGNKHLFNYYILFPEQGFIYCNAIPLENKQPQEVPDGVPYFMPSIPELGVDVEDASKIGIGVGVGALILKLLESGLNKVTPVVMPPLIEYQIEEYKSSPTMYEGYEN